MVVACRAEDTERRRRDGSGGRSLRHAFHQAARRVDLADGHIATRGRAGLFKLLAEVVLERSLGRTLERQSIGRGFAQASRGHCSLSTHKAQHAQRCSDQRSHAGLGGSDLLDRLLACRLVVLAAGGVFRHPVAFLRVFLDLGDQGPGLVLTPTLGQLLHQELLVVGVLPPDAGIGLVGVGQRLVDLASRIATSHDHGSANAAGSGPRGAGGCGQCATADRISERDGRRGAAGSGDGASAKSAAGAGQAHHAQEVGQLLDALRNAERGIGDERLDGSEVLAKEPLLVHQALAVGVLLRFEYVGLLRLKFLLRLTQGVGQRAAGSDDVDRELRDCYHALSKARQRVGCPLAGAAPLLSLLVADHALGRGITAGSNHVAEAALLALVHLLDDLLDLAIGRSHRVAGAARAAHDVGLAHRLLADWAGAVGQASVNLGLLLLRRGHVAFHHAGLRGRAQEVPDALDQAAVVGRRRCALHGSGRIGVVDGSSGVVCRPPECCL